MNSVDMSLTASTKHGVVDGLERALTRLIEIPAIVALVAEVGILFTGVMSRFVFNRPLTWADELASITFLWLAMFGAVLALSRGEHMRMTALVDRVSPRVRAVLECLALMAPALFLGILLHPAIDYANGQSFVETPALGLSDSLRAGAVPVGIGLMLATALLRMTRHASRDLAIALVLLATVALVLWGTAPALKALGNWNLIVFFALLLGAAVLAGVPIAFCFGLATIAYLLTVTTAPLEVVTSRIDEGVSSLVLLAIPLFILLGHLIVMTRMAEAMVGFLVSLVGHVRGGLSYVLLGAILLVSGISGAKTADMAAVAPVLFPDMKRRGIHDGELVSLLAASGAMAETIPPSIVLIIIGSVAGVSISALFTGGILPGLVLAAALAIVAKRRMVEPESVIRPRPSWGTIRAALITAIPALLLPVLIRTAVTEGVATATEVSTIGIAYAVIVGLLVYRRFDWRKLYPALVHTAALSGAILFIIGAATAMAWALTQSNFSHALAAMMTSVPGGKYGFLLISIAVFVLLGSILEGLPAMVLFGPLLFPAAKLLGVHEVHYAMVIILAMGIGLFAPPFGLGYYAACSIGQIDPNAGLARIWPYLGALVLGLLLVAFIPWLSIGFL
ncbi:MULTISPECIES: TRAP transporter large permease subunit [Bradyrhizobium]|jgi:tripartite ATP-independent transporter DctM subunit|uniref:TRAP transporter large permease subunit n=7 Tax=Bacteria TaxID=2 RepID=A0ABS5GEI8_9BRAD|nr:MULTISPECIES: TRAP transporter large permease subunit [Bradyrhizobium]MDU6248391.1 TRAP transporter large permease subunit [Paeniclostridium sordellii]MBR1139419.1 TRAP transporter large permease subunit [Bradyrhizobium denitrificans]MDU1495963.1 TRAP transporter large permease subunit [Bradyrhizobium sp.]MDU1546114.1 TRAP transporter large permease subunit [Bradyrhizobium sp.]MDU1690931.1 TRAP transporter large permease subunit [Bradyrhizobium sp.]